jgi:competence CoiA-like predicted nuclease
MQEKFPKDRHEVSFISYSVNEKTEHRRTDVLLSNTHCLEIQHSYISQDDVGLRKKDWEKFGKTLVWLVDGNTSDVTIEHLSDSNIIITFFAPWKFTCFLHNSYEYILLEQNDRVYKVRLHDIKYKMVKVYKSYDIDSIVNHLIQTPETIWDVWKDSNTVPSRMIVHQKGAGNGKTYSIWKSILMNENKDQYIIVTKQHSAKSVI